MTTEEYTRPAARVETAQARTPHGGMYDIDQAKVVHAFFEDGTDVYRCAAQVGDRFCARDFPTAHAALIHHTWHKPNRGHGGGRRHSPKNPAVEADKFAAEITAAVRHYLADRGRQITDLEGQRDQWKRRALTAEKRLDTLRKALS